VITNRRLFIGLPLGAVLVSLVILAVLQWRSKSVVIEAGFWFDDVSFDLAPLDAEQLGGPLTVEDKAVIQDVAWQEVRAAYANLRLRLTDNRNAFYKVRVVQGPLGAMSKLSRGAAGETHVMGPLGGSSQVSFAIVARGAFAYAPPGADRRTIVEAIGRGVGRTTVHELEHQILGAQSVHSPDDRSYEYGSPDRIGQYYGPIHWDTALEPLVRRLGR
jgi:hypothetical protein